MVAADSPTHSRPPTVLFAGCSRCRTVHTWAARVHKYILHVDTYRRVCHLCYSMRRGGGEVALTITPGPVVPECTSISSQVPSSPDCERGERLPRGVDPHLLKFLMARSTSSWIESEGWAALESHDIDRPSVLSRSVHPPRGAGTNDRSRSVQVARRNVPSAERGGHTHLTEHCAASGQSE